MTETEYLAVIRVHFTADDEDDAMQRASAMAESLDGFDGVISAQAASVE